MDEQINNCEARMKSLVDEGCSLAQAFLRTFAHEDLQDKQPLINRILNRFSIQGTEIDGDYYFVDGSRLSIDPAVESMLATKSKPGRPL